VRDSSNADSVERRPADDSAAGAPARGSRALTAILPNGKVVWLRSVPPLAPAADLRHLADLAEHSARGGRPDPDRIAGRSSTWRARRPTTPSV
jgi:hypothetical protein